MSTEIATLILYIVAAIITGISIGVQLSFAGGSYVNAKAFFGGLLWPLTLVALILGAFWIWIREK